ncbi:MAG: Selenocysteine synthase terminal, partial [Frankiaceae bacterium]|nr:Selenocysteine synthase terminal [Frankiaceae bacterium]
MTDVRRSVPRTDSVLADPRLTAAAESLGATAVKDVVQRMQELVRCGDL